MSIRRVYLGVGTWELFLCFFVLRHRRVEQVLTPRMSLLGGIRLYKIITNSIVYFAFRVLPRSCNCTGGNDLWKSSFVNGSERWCEGQKADACKVLNGTVILFITTTN